MGHPVEFSLKNSLIHIAYKFPVTIV